MFIRSFPCTPLGNSRKRAKILYRQVYTPKGKKIKSKKRNYLTLLLITTHPKESFFRVAIRMAFVWRETPPLLHDIPNISHDRDDGKEKVRYPVIIPKTNKLVQDLLSKTHLFTTPPPPPFCLPPSVLCLLSSGNSHP